MTQAGIEPTKRAPKRFPLAAIIVAALATAMAFCGGIAYVWSEGWPIVGIASMFAAIPVGAAPMYRVMTHLSTRWDATRVDRSENPRGMLWLVLGSLTAINVVAFVAVRWQLFSAGLGFAGGIMLGLFWWMVRQRVDSSAQ